MNAEDITKLQITAGGFTLPIGAIIENMNQPAESTIIRGTGGGARHGASFSPDNPAVPFLDVATNNQDIDALFSRGVEWEFDLANYLRQRADARADLLEQREYELPINQVARERDAGINPDIAGSGGSGGVSSGSSATVNPVAMADQASNVNTKNSYETTDRVIAGINTGISLVQTFAGAATAATQMYEAFTLLPSRQRIASAQADQAETQAAISAATKGDVIKGKGLQTAVQSAELVKTLASMFDEDATVESISAALPGYGVAADVLPGIAQSVYDYRKSPQYKRNLQEDLRKANEDTAFNLANPIEELQQIEEGVQSIRRLSINYEKSGLQLKTSINDYLAKMGYANKFAKSQVAGTENDIKAQELAGLMLDRDLNVFTDLLEQTAWAANEIQNRMYVIGSRASKEGRVLNDREMGTLRSMLTRKKMLTTLGSQNLYSLYDILDNVNAQMAYEEFAVREESNYVQAPFLPQLAIKNELSFRQIMQGNMNRSQIIDGVLDGVGAAASAFIRSRFNKGTTVNKSFTTNNGGQTYSVIQ